MDHIILLTAALKQRFPEAKIELTSDSKSLFLTLHRTHIIIELNKGKYNKKAISFKSHYLSNPALVSAVLMISLQLFQDVRLLPNFLFDENGDLFEAVEPEDYPSEKDSVH